MVYPLPAFSHRSAQVDKYTSVRTALSPRDTVPACKQFCGRILKQMDLLLRAFHRRVRAFSKLPAADYHWQRRLLPDAHLIASRLQQTHIPCGQQ